MLKKVIGLFAVMMIVFQSMGQSINQPPKVEATSDGLAKKYAENYQKAIALAKQKGWPMSMQLNKQTVAVLVGVDYAGFPKYYVNYNNTIAAATTRANQLWPGGSSGLNLTGSSSFLTNKLGIWDGGQVLGSHQELTGRVEQKDNPSSVSDHATHVSGTMIATGVNPLAKGMAYEAPSLLAWDFSNDVPEIAAAANGLVLSNHSYGILAGWTYNSTNSRWEFRGDPGATEDYKFGYYSDDARSLDSIAYINPNYLIVKAAGNSRNQNGPAVGQPYFRYNAAGSMVSAGNRPVGISSNDGYDIISWDANAKNILTVGAVNGLPNGYTRPADVAISTFSSWGPTDDGRIKPDIVGDGVGVLSCVGTASDAYSSYNGTSMASPNVTGSLFLLQEHYGKLNGGKFLRSATLKGLAIHTADEAGTADGPDYIYGWGLLNVLKASKIISVSDGGEHLMKEETLNNKETKTYQVTASGNGKLIATISWTDPEGTVETVNMLNNRTPKLVNDLDLRITKDGTTYLPWKLDPNNPSDNATRGDNIVDNVERVEIDNPVPGDVYTITVTHKATLTKGNQPFSLLVSGIGGKSICTSEPTQNGGTRIDSVVIGSVKKVNVSGCTSYSNFKTTTIELQPNQKNDVTIGLSSCNSSNASRVVKVYVDYNSDGVFDNNEQVLSSGIISGGNQVFQASFTTPFGLIAGNFATMRIVAQETTDASLVNACGSYTAGETQDYLVKFTNPSNDLAVVALNAPLDGACANSQQLVVVQLQNKGSVTKSSIPVTATIKDATTGNTVATVNSVFPGSLDGGATFGYTIQKTFNMVAGAKYNIVVSVTSANDQNPANDTLIVPITVASKENVTGTARVCGNSVVLKVDNPANNGNYFWYDSPISSKPIASGASYTGNQINAANTYYVNRGANVTTGLSSKNLFPDGGGYLTSNSTNYLNYTAQVPVILESARLYVRYPGKINFYATDLVNGYFTFLTSTTVDVYATSADPQPGAQGANFDNNDTGAIYYLNLPLPAGSHSILAIPQGDANLFRNNNIPSTNPTYPFVIPEIISITGNGASPQNTYYYYFYNMQIKTQDCVSDRSKIIATTAPTPTITQVGDSLVSSVANGNQWYSGAGGATIIVGATSNKFNPSGSGIYSVAVTDAQGCRRTSADFTYLATAVNNVSNDEIGLVVGPNPTANVFKLSFKVTSKANLSIEMIDVSGKTVYQKQVSGFVGTYNQQLDTKSFSPGTYLLKIQHGNKVYRQKIVVQQ